ncbi:MAG: DMT family transporter [Rhodobacteraceae bacterium]|nr:DMT family transporter [Paracoccaceae bacterium]
MSGDQSPFPAGASDEQKPVLAALWMLGSVVGFSAIAISGREIGAALQPPEMMFYRSAIGVLLILGYATLTGRRGEITRRHLALHGLRNVIHFAGQNFWLYGLALIPLAQLFAVEFSSPLIVALAAPLFLDERLTRTRLFCALTGFVGILIVARPFSDTGLSAGILFALASAFCFAGTTIVTKRLTRRVSVVCILFWLALMQTFLALVVSGWDGAIAIPAAKFVPWVVLMGIGGIAAHLSLTMALSLAAATIVVPVDFLRLPVIAVIGMLAYGEPLDIWVFVGGAVIFAANWFNLRSRDNAQDATLL